MHDLTVTLIQSALAWQQADANRAHFGRLIHQLDEKADLIILPEMFTTGFTMQPGGLAETMDGPSLAWLGDVAAASGSTVCGSLIIEDKGRTWNRLVWMRPDRSCEWYDKRHLFRMAGEHEHYAAGQERLVTEVAGWRVCPLICYDLRFPVFSRGANAFDLQLFVANWPAARHSSWQALLPARAIENQCYVAGVNRTGQDGNGAAYRGGSAVYDYLGRELVQAAEAETTLSIRLDGAALMRYREKFPAWQDADHFELRAD